MTTTTFYPGSGNGDGTQVSNSMYSQAQWDAIHDATTASGVEYNVTESTTYYSPGRWSNASTVQNMRSYYPIDTSSLTSGATITDATFSVYVTDHYSASVPGGAPMGFSLLQGNQTSTTALSTSDYPPASWTKLATDISDASITTSAYNTWTLNSSGKGAINKTGVTSLVTTTQLDADDYYTASASWVTRLLVRFVGYTGTSSDPYLSVTYTVATGPANLKSYNTNVKANIKSINTNVIANIKSLNTNS